MVCYNKLQRAELCSNETVVVCTVDLHELLRLQYYCRMRALRRLARTTKGTYYCVVPRLFDVGRPRATSAASPWRACPRTRQANANTQYNMNDVLLTGNIKLLYFTVIAGLHFVDPRFASLPYVLQQFCVNLHRGELPFNRQFFCNMADVAIENRTEPTILLRV